jgi:pimeloyl-CoA synthetase
LIYRPKLIIDKELTSEYLHRLTKEYGSNRVYYFISSNKSLVKFNVGNEHIREQVANYAYEEIKKRGVCKSDSILDKTGSWFNERDDIYINFFCEN